MISDKELPRFEQLFAQLNVPKKKKKNYPTKKHTPKKNQTLKNQKKREVLPKQRHQQKLERLSLVLC